jgi:FMN-dependent NADH-azoreductase
MKTLLAIHSSGRTTRSVTRSHVARFVQRWRSRAPAFTLVERDVGLAPPPGVSEPWIAAAFDWPRSRPDGVLRESEALIEEIESADAIVLGVPMYNFGMPAQLKAYFDQVIRIDRTFSFHPGATQPYRPLLASKPCVVIMSVSDETLYPGGALAHLNFVESHLRTLWAFIGIRELEFVRALDTDDRARTARSMADVDTAADGMAAQVFHAPRWQNCPLSDLRVT